MRDIIFASFAICAPMIIVTALCGAVAICEYVGRRLGQAGKGKGKGNGNGIRMRPPAPTHSNATRPMRPYTPAPIRFTVYGEHDSH